MAPSNTELLYSLGAEDKLVGVCTQCDYPPQVKSKQRVGNFVTPDLEKLAAVRPDGIFLVDGQEPMEATIEKQNAFSTQPTLLTNTTLADISSNLVMLGNLTGNKSKALELSDQFDQTWKKIQQITSSSGSKPKVFFCVWPEPLVTIGKSSYLNDCITICGGTNVAGDIQGAYPQFNFEKLIVEQPDVIIMPAEAEHNLAEREPWRSLKAVKNHRLYFLPARESDRLSRPTLRVLEGLYWLAERVHPECAKALSMSKNSIRHLLTASTPNRLKP